MPPKPEMIQAVLDLFELFEKGFKKEKFRNGIKSSFIKTGTMPTTSTDADVHKFVEYTVDSICGMKWGVGFISRRWREIPA